MPRERLITSGQAFVLAKSAPLELDQRVRNLVMTRLPAPAVESMLSNEPVVSSVVGWIALGTAVGIASLAIGCLLSLVDRILGGRRRQRHLVNLGVSPHQLTVLGALLFAIPYSVVTVVGLVTGFVICVMMLSPEVPIPWPRIGVIVTSTVLLGLAGTASVAVLGSPEALRVVD